MLVTIALWAGLLAPAEVSVEARQDVREAIALRMARHTLVEQADAEGYRVVVEIDGEGRAIVRVHRAGRTWERRVEAPVGELSQEVAAEAVSLLDAVVETTRDEVLVPEAPALQPPPSPVAPPEPKPEPEPEPRPEPEPEPEPLPEPLPESPRWAVDVSLGAALVGTVSGQALGGAGGLLAVGGRSEQGLVLGAEGRAIGRGLPRGLGVARLRLALLAGYLHSLGPWEVGGVAGASVEPWWPLQRGRRIGVHLDGARQRPAPLLGGLARVSASRRVGRRRRVTPRLGLFLEVAGSGSPDGGLARLALGRPEGGHDVVGTLGGLELAAGLSVAFRVGSP